MLAQQIQQGAFQRRLDMHGGAQVEGLKPAPAGIAVSETPPHPAQHIVPGAQTNADHQVAAVFQGLADFLAACRETIPTSGQELLNVTLRYLEPDPVSMLAYAPVPRIALVMLFPQAMTGEAEESMRKMTERLIDQVLALGGSYYLPYRLHARPDQLRAAYTGIDAFIAKKRAYDPQLRFRNMMWDKYFA